MLTTEERLAIVVVTQNTSRLPLLHALVDFVKRLHLGERLANELLKANQIVRRLCKQITTTHKVFIVHFYLWQQTI